MATNDPFDGIHMHDATGQILPGAELVSLLQSMDKDTTFSDDMVTVGDSAKLVVPRGMTMREVITSLFSYWYNQQQPTTFRRTFNYRPHDGALAAYRQLKKVYGFVDGKPTESFFGSTPPQMITVHTGLNDTTQVPWGELRVSALAGAVITFTEDEDDRFGTVFCMEVTAPRRLEPNIEMLFASIEMELAEHSIYRGKAIKAGGGTEPKFVDLGKVDPDSVVYASDVQRTLEANLWMPMRETVRFRRDGLPLKQGVLAYGNFGTGKSLAGFLTAKIAVENGWTAILAESGDDLEELLELAAMFGPAFVFCEDIDKVARADAENIEGLLEAFDGVVTKGREVLLLATTNNIGDLHAGMLRPGRFDVLVEIGMLDADSIEKLIRQQVGGALEENIDFAAICAEMKGFTPAFIAQVIQRTRKYAMLDKAARLGTAHFVAAAKEMQGHLQLMQAAGTKPQPSSVNTALGELVDARVAATLGAFRLELGGRSGRLIHDPSSTNGGAQELTAQTWPRARASQERGALGRAAQHPSGVFCFSLARCGANFLRVPGKFVVQFWC